MGTVLLFGIGAVIALALLGVVLLGVNVVLGLAMVALVPIFSTTFAVYDATRAGIRKATHGVQAFRRSSARH
jgi:hypothetical protein